MKTLKELSNERKSKSTKLTWKTVYIFENAVNKEEKDNIRHFCQDIIFAGEWNKEVYLQLKNAGFFKANANKPAIIEYLKLNKTNIEKVK